MKRILVAVMLLCMTSAGAASFVAVPGAVPDMKPIFDQLEDPVFTTIMPIHLDADDKLDLAIHFYRVRFGAPGNN